VEQYHYSGRVASAVIFVGSLHLSGGLFGDQGECVAAAFFSHPPTRWKEEVIELTRLVRKDGVRVPLTLLISRSLRQLKRLGHDLVVSFADTTHGHEGYVYRAANWNYAGKRERSCDGLLINGTFVPGRQCNDLYGSRSVEKVSGVLRNATVEPHYDEGKHLYWKALGSRGVFKASRLGLIKS
jgi:hypothetical protein